MVFIAEKTFGGKNDVETITLPNLTLNKHKIKKKIPSLPYLKEILSFLRANHGIASLDLICTCKLYQRNEVITLLFFKSGV